MECNKRNRNICYVIFRDSNLKKLSEYFVLQSNIFLCFCDRFSKLKNFSRFWTVIFYIFGRFAKMKCHTFLRVALWHIRTKMKSRKRWRMHVNFGLSSCETWTLLPINNNWHTQLIRNFELRIPRKSRGISAILFHNFLRDLSFPFVNYPPFFHLPPFQKYAELPLRNKKRKKRISNIN